MLTTLIPFPVIWVLNSPNSSNWRNQLANPKCTEIVRVSKVKISENGKQAVFLNPKKEEFSRTRVDGCVIVNRTACDWWVAHETSGSVLVELKGCDVEHAIEQIEATFDYLSKHNLLLEKNAAMIVCSKPSRHPSFTTKLQKARSRLSAKYKAPLHIVTGSHEFDIKRVLLHIGPF
jgi:hypothetical protein